LIVEARDKRALATGVASLEVSIARRINALLGRRGRVWSDRYHRHDLHSPREVRNALRYVLGNVKKHARLFGAGTFADPCSSGGSFDGWSVPAEIVVHPFVETEPWPRVPPWSWLLGVGWRRHGLLAPSDRPAAR
jgi:hypothetical protein